MSEQNEQIVKLWADAPLSANPSAMQVRARFDELDEAMPEHYEQEIWDAQLVAWYLIQEVLAALSAPSAATPREPAGDPRATP